MKIGFSRFPRNHYQIVPRIGGDGDGRGDFFFADFLVSSTLLLPHLLGYPHARGG